MMIPPQFFSYPVVRWGPLDPLCGLGEIYNRTGDHGARTALPGPRSGAKTERERPSGEISTLGFSGGIHPPPEIRASPSDNIPELYSEDPGHYRLHTYVVEMLG